MSSPSARRTATGSVNNDLGDRIEDPEHEATGEYAGRGVVLAEHFLLQVIPGFEHFEQKSCEQDGDEAPQDCAAQGSEESREIDLHGQGPPFSGLDYP